MDEAQRGAKNEPIEAAISNILEKRKKFIPAGAGELLLPEGTIDAGPKKEEFPKLEPVPEKQIEVLGTLLNEPYPEFEIELSLGWYDDKGFKPGVFSAKQFSDIKAELDKEVERGVLVMTSIMRRVEIRNEISENVRKITNLETSDVTYQTKLRFSSPRVENAIMGFRVTRSKETSIPAPNNFSADTTRTIQRFSYTADSSLNEDYYGFSIDLSIVIEENPNRPSSLKFEVEVERINKLSADYVDRLIKLTGMLITWSQNIPTGGTLLTLPRRGYIVTALNTLISRFPRAEGKPFNKPFLPYQLIKGYWSKPVNIMLSDLTRTDWDVTIKLDGVRSFLFIYHEKVWLCNPPYDINFWGNLNTGAHSNTLLDGEVITTLVDGEEKRLFYCFDILFLNGADVRNSNLFERLNLIETFIRETKISRVYRKHFAKYDDKMSLPSSTADISHRIQEYQIILEPLQKEISIRECLSNRYAKLEVILKTANIPKLISVKDDIKAASEKLEIIYGMPIKSEEKIKEFMGLEKVTQEDIQKLADLTDLLSNYNITAEEIKGYNITLISAAKAKKSYESEFGEPEPNRGLSSAIINSAKKELNLLTPQLVAEKNKLDRLKNEEENTKKSLLKEENKANRSKLSDLRVAISDQTDLIANLQAQIQVQTEYLTKHQRKLVDRTQEKKALAEKEKENAKLLKSKKEEIEIIFQTTTDKVNEALTKLKKLENEIFDLRRTIAANNEVILKTRKDSIVQVQNYLNELLVSLEKGKGEEKVRELEKKYIGVAKRHLEELKGPTHLLKAMEALEEENLTEAQRTALEEKVKMAHEARSGLDIITEANKLRDIESSSAGSVTLYSYVKAAINAVVKDNVLSNANVDGIIFQSLRGYMGGTKKWKFPQTLTIDFLFRPTSLTDEYELMVSDKRRLVSFIGTNKFPLDTPAIVTIAGGIFNGELVSGRVLECKWDPAINNFVPQRFRDDRGGMPNDMIPARSVWDDINDPISKGTITGNTLAIMRRYHNQVKSEALSNNFIKGDTIIGLGEGQGGDLNKYAKIGIKKVFAIEPDKDQVAEMMRRYEQMDAKPELVIINSEEEYVGGQNTNVIVREISGTEIAGLVAFFSLTFFAKDEEMWQGLMNTLDQTIPVGGKFIGAVMDGKTVRNSLEKTKDLEIVNDAFYIKAKKKKFTKNYVGNAIELDIAESHVRNQTEYLFDFEYFVSELEKLGFVLLTAPFLTSTLYRSLPESAKLFSSFCRSFSFIRRAKTAEIIARPITNIGITKIPKGTKKKVERELEETDVAAGTELSTQIVMEKLFAGTPQPGPSTIILAVLASLSKPDTDILEIRKSLGEEIPQTKFKSLQNGIVFQKYKTLKAFRTALANPKVYLNDDVLIQLLSEKYKIAIIVLSGAGAVPNRNFCDAIGKHNSAIIIYSEDGVKYSSVKDSKSLSKWKIGTEFIVNLIKYVCE